MFYLWHSTNDISVGYGSLLTWWLFPRSRFTNIPIPILNLNLT